MALTFTDIQKEGQFFVLTAEERKNPIKFDCINGTFITPRKVFPAWTMPASFYNLNSYAESNPYFRYHDNFIRDFMYVMYCGFSRLDVEGLKRLVNILETVYANKDLLVDKSFHINLDNLKEFPRGYFAWLKKENRVFCDSTLRLFKYKDYLKNPKVDALVADLQEHYGFAEVCEADVEPQVLFDLAQVHAVFKKEFSWQPYDDMREFYRTLFRYHKEKLLPNLDKWLDKNRGYKHNLDLAMAFVNKERNDKILANENKIRDIENLENEFLCIKVPSTIEDFTNEGKMQNNCVGSYYHDHIAQGVDLIYFIRKKDNVEHSYITCRYRIDEYCTVEYRIVNNDNVTDKNAIAFIKQIDTKIQTLLKGEG